MKKQKSKSTAVILAICLFSLSAFAGKGYDQLPIHHLISFISSTDMQVDVKWIPVSETLNVTIENPFGKKMTVTLFDENGSILIKSLIPAGKKELQKNYLFSGAEEGNYQIEVCDGSKIIKKKIKLERVQKVETVVSIN